EGGDPFLAALLDDDAGDCPCYRAVAVVIFPPVLVFLQRQRKLAADQPFVKSDKEPLTLKIDDKRTLQCVYIPPGRFLMGTPVYMWPYYQEEYPHLVTLTKPYYLAEVPVTQEMYEAVMGNNPSTVKDPQLPVQNPRFADIKKFCDLLSER